MDGNTGRTTDRPVGGGGCRLVVAGTAISGEIRGLFEGLVPAEVIDAYDRLRATDGCAKDQAEALVGDAGLVSALTSWGMAHVLPHSPADPPWLCPASPDLALQGVLARHQNRLARDQELLLDGQRRLADHTTAMLPLTPTGTSGALIVRAPIIIAARRRGWIG